MFKHHSYLHTGKATVANEKYTGRTRIKLIQHAAFLDAKTDLLTVENS